MRNITILCFSGRSNGNCRSVADYIISTFQNAYICSFIVPLIFEPCNGCDYQCLKPGEACPKITNNQRDMMERLLESDLIYYIIPNYCGVPCANYYAFNERCVGYFNGDRSVMGKFMKLNKRFIMISNTENTAFETVIKQQSSTEAKALYLKTSKYKKNSINGDLMTSKDATDDLTAFLAADL